MTKLRSTMSAAIAGHTTTPHWISDSLKRARNDDSIVDAVGFCMPHSTGERSDDARQALGWAAGTFASLSNDLDEIAFAVALIIVSRLNQEQDFWVTFKQASVSHEALVERLAEEVERHTPTVSPSVTEPVSGSEIVAKLRIAEEEQNWPKICQFLSHLPWHPHDEVHDCAVNALMALDFERLATCATRTKTVLGAYFVLQSLSEHDALRTAETVTDVRVRFAALVHALIPRRRMPTRAERGYIERILKQAARSKTLWHGWMEAFNPHPLRMPGLQIPLGEVLCHAPPTAIISYVNTLHLSATSEPGHPSSHAEISACLDEFRSRAPEHQRLLLWRHAFNRWREWNFGEGHLLGMSRSQLDYPTLGWLIQGNTTDVIERSILACSTELSEFEDQWHASLSDLRSKRFKVLSRLQVYAMAEKIRNDGGDWTTIGHISTLDAFDTPYFRAKYPHRDL